MMHLPLCDKLSLDDLKLRNQLSVNQFNRILLLILHSGKRFDNTKILSQSTLLSKGMIMNFLTEEMKRFDEAEDPD